ncbi:MAG: insulinase family protein [Holosporaceae bacterium]|jgi:predicted Zn-dependent peptidase|nr:insulinase family protein [Holosporaceae bacterium]
MVRRFIVFLVFIFFLNSEAEKFRGIEQYKLENDVTVIFVDTAWSNSLLVMLCVSAGSSDEIEKRGVANLLAHLFARKLRESVGEDLARTEAENNVFVGHDQSIFYLVGRRENLDLFIRGLGSTFSGGAFPVESIKECQQYISKKNQGQISDKASIREEVMRSLYWHSPYGIPVEGNSKAQSTLTKTDLKEFTEACYLNEKATIIIVGNVDKNATKQLILRNFPNKEMREWQTRERLQEPSHHGSTVRITKQSQQVRLPILELYWRIPVYRKNAKQAVAAEIFVNHLMEILPDILVELLRIASSISFYYSFWNSDDGEVCISITLREKDARKIDQAILAVTTEIKNISSNGISEEQARKAAKKLSDSANVFTSNTDEVDVVDWLAKKIGAGYDLNFLKSYVDFVNKFDLKEINEQAKEIFKKDPSVVSIVTPQKTI